MSTNRSRRIDRDTAEQLLGGAAAGTPGGRAPLTGQDGTPGRQSLARLLAAAAAPEAAAGDLPGEEAALAAFRAAARPATVTDPAPVRGPLTAAPPRRRSMATAGLARAFSAKAAAVALLATALGGVAVAAGTGNLPAALGGGPGPSTRVAAPVTQATASDRAPAAGSGTPGAVTRSQAPGTTPGAGRASGAPGAPASGVPSPDATPDGRGVPGVNGAGGGSTGADPSRSAAATTSVLLTLCQGLAEGQGKDAALRSLSADPRFAPLVKAAGGQEKVTAFCAAIVAGTAGSARGTDPAPATPTAGTGQRGGQPGATAPAAADPDRTARLSMLPAASDDTSARR
ncbi:hypothetical protein [Kitasatospora sp. NBC_00315]|uniref:hypothetical protein n=1 Tax=Kitasatospora sp. NBC_00315 TaxID=2975963 RepID=UPI00325111BC